MRERSKYFIRMLSLMLMLVFIIGLVPVEAATVKISKAKAVMEIDSTLTLKLKNATDSVTWKTSAKSIASVSKKGKVTAKAEGKATITATSGGKKYTCLITVKDSNKEDAGSKEKLVVDQDGVKIYSRGLSAPSNEYLLGYYLNIRIENNSSKDITVQARDISANGYVVKNSVFSSDVPAGKKILDEVWLLDNGVVASIDDVEEVELRFHVFDEDSWDNIFDSNLIVIEK